MTQRQAKLAAYWDVSCWIRQAVDIRVLDSTVDEQGEDLPLADVLRKRKAYGEIADEMERRTWPRNGEKR